MIHGKRATRSRRRGRPAVLLLVLLAYGRTLKSLNDSVEDRVSDHSRQAKSVASLFGVAA